MNRALIWKEFREQGLIVAALVLLGGGVLVAAGLLFPAPNDSAGDMRLTLESRKLAIVLLTLASGVVVGGTLFAGEREQGTFPYLEILPVPRYRVWLGKILAGLALVLIASGSLFAVAAVVGVVGPPARLPFWALIIGSLAVAAFSWGSLGSAFAKTSLAACGLGLLSAMALLFVIYPACALGVQFYDAVAASVWKANPTVNHAEIVLLGTLFGLMVVPLALSAWIYTAPDRNRVDRDVRIAKGTPVDPPRRRQRIHIFPTGGFRASLWVVARQNRLLAMVLGVTAVISGLGYLEPSVPVLFIWPVATLMIGTIVGVTGWSDEQNSGAFRFWAERRMPIGRLWLAKVAYGFALIAALLTAMALPSLIAARAQGSGLILATAFRARVFLERGFPIAEFLLIWSVYGFAFGHLAGLLFRKAAVGTAVGLMTGGAVVAFWLPSLLSGGIHWYQLWIPPLLALVTARSLVWSWALDQLGRRRALQRLGFGGSTIAATMLAGILYRMLEIPEDANTEADIAFRATIPPFDTNDAGREIRRGALLYADMKLAQRAAPAAAERPLWSDGPSQQPSDLNTAKRRSQFEFQLDDVLALGWPSDRPDADAWLDACMASEWAELLVNASRMPIGTVEDPVEMVDGSVFKHLNALQGCETMLLARGLQLQGKGHPEAFVESVRASLGLARNLRNKSFYLCGLIAQRIETRTHLGLQRWLEKLGDRADLLREILGLIQAHDATCPKLLADGNLPEQVMMRNSMDAPTQFVKQYWMGQPFRNRDSSEDREALENETELVAFAWTVPWEKERLRRLVGLGNRRAITRAERPLFQGLPGFGDYARASALAEEATKRAPDLEREELAARRASLLLLALRLHRAEKGALPATLDALAPGYLPAVPLDPYDDRPFRYRISKGESIAMESIPAPIPGKPETFAALLGGSGYGVNGRVDEYTDRAGAYLDRCGALLGGLGHEVERDPSHYLFDRFGGPAGVGFVPDSPVLLAPVVRMLDLPAGRGILWSVGPDKIDDGGKVWADPKTGASTTVRTGDLIYPVPEPAQPKR